MRRTADLAKVEIPTIEFLLPYQQQWLRDRAKVKVWEKSRRIGASWVQACEDVIDIISGAIPDVWFSSADESAAREYIRYCEYWATAMNAVADNLGITVIDETTGVKTFSLEFAVAAKRPRINAMSSNPKGFRSKGGKVVLDEFAFHGDQDAMWKAAKPSSTWGYPVRILSSHNGRACRFYKFIEAIRNGKLGWSLHTTDIHRAVEDGLVDKIMGRPTTAAERQAWIEEQRRDCFDEETWLQEYCCQPVDEAAAFMPYELLYRAERELPLATTPADLHGEKDLYLGMDIARHRHLTVFYVVQDVGGMLVTRACITLQGASFPEQRAMLYQLAALPGMRRVVIDANGLGMQLAEEAQIEFGQWKVEAATFNGPVKERLAWSLRNAMDDSRFYYPPDERIRSDFHSVRKLTTIAGNTRFDAEATDDGHADRFWAAALAVNAASSTHGAPVHVITHHDVTGIRSTLNGL